MLKVVERCWTKIELGSIPFNKLPAVERLKPIVFRVWCHVVSWQYQHGGRRVGISWVRVRFASFLSPLHDNGDNARSAKRQQHFLVRHFNFAPKCCCCSTKVEWVFNKLQQRSTLVDQQKLNDVEPCIIGFTETAPKQRLGHTKRMEA